MAGTETPIFPQELVFEDNPRGSSGGSGGSRGEAGRVDDNGPEIIDPGTGSAETIEGTGTGPIPSAGSETPRRRGRPPGSGKGTARKSSSKSTVDLSFVETTLLSIHGILAGALSQPALELTKVEAGELAKAIGRVQEQYPLTLDPKTQAWVSLGIVASTIYGPRFYLMREMTRARRARPTQPAPEAAPERPASQAGATTTGGRQEVLTPSQLFGAGYRG